MAMLINQVIKLLALHKYFKVFTLIQYRQVILVVRGWRLLLGERELILVVWWNFLKFTVVVTAAVIAVNQPFL